MIDEQRILGMIPAKALECLSPEDNIEIESHINEGLPFPWDELGRYQIAASLLPLSLQLETPDPALKDNVARKLIKLAEELKLKKQQEEEALKAAEEALQPPEEIPVGLEETPETISEDIKFKEPAEVDSFNLDEINLPDIEQVNLNEQVDVTENQIEDFETETGKLDIPSFEQLSSEDTETHTDLVEKPVEEIISESEVDLSESEISEPEPTTAITQDEKLVEETSDYKPVESPKKSLTEKMYQALELDFDNVKSAFNELDKKTTKNLLLTYVAIAVLLAILIFTFFKFTADIKSLENKIDQLHKSSTSELIEKNITDLSSHLS